MSTRVVVLFGPTAVGKTGLTERVFSKGYEIINSDSVQVYRHLDIGSAKPGADILSLIPHHMVSMLEPYEQFTVGDYCEKAETFCREITERGNVPLLTGGTAYYFRQFLYGCASTPVADPAIREKVKKWIDKVGKEEAWKKLDAVDPVAASRINVNDVYRISRALEVWLQTGRPLSSFAVKDKVRPEIDPLVIGLKRDKAELEERIRLRVDQMFDEGLEDEIKMLRDMGADASWPGMQGIGYKEFFTEGIPEDEIREKIVTSSRKYAKRQMTFFRSFDNVHWLHPDDTEGIIRLLDENGLPHA